LEGSHEAGTGIGLSLSIYFKDQNRFLWITCIFILVKIKKPHPPRSPFSSRGEGGRQGVEGKTMNITKTARNLRKNQTQAEKLFWQKVRNNLLGKKFVRQKPIIFDYDDRKNVFYADFYCAECKLIVEIDGEIHKQKLGYDNERSIILN
jgi:very-short-patch-repair endonuclease